MSNSLSENMYKISPNAERWIKISAITVMLIVATSSAILSFEGLRSVALEAKIPNNLSFLFPIAVDATILMGSLSVLRFELAGAKSYFGWLTVFLGTLLSIGGNVLSVIDDGWVAQVVHGLIPVLLCISLESLLKILRFNIKKSHIFISSVETHESLNKLTQEQPIQSHTSESQSFDVSEASVPPNSIISPLELNEKDNEEIDKVIITNEKDSISGEELKDISKDTPKHIEPINEGKDEDPVTKYKKIISSLPDDTKKAKKIYILLNKFPDAKLNDLKKAIGDPPSANYTAIVKKIKDMKNS